MWDRAAEIPLQKFRKEINERIEGSRTTEPVRTVSIAAGESVIADFRRSQVIASRRARAVLSDGETLAAITDEYLTRHDPARTKRRTRRIGPTSERPNDRYVPREVFAALLLRSGDRCEVPGCRNRIFLAIAHLLAHGEFGDRELWNLFRMCDPHHALFDAKGIRFLEWKRDGEGVLRPVFVDATTGEVRIARGCDPERAPPTQPAPTRPATSPSATEPPPAGWPSDVRERAPTYARPPPERTSMATATARAM